MYASWQEQVEVEEYYQNNVGGGGRAAGRAGVTPAPATPARLTCCAPGPQGYLLPLYHRKYWIGMYAVTWPYFKYADPLLGGYVSLANNYTNWGNDTSTGNNYPSTDGYNCGTAVYTLAINPSAAGTPDATWGWMDTLCNTTNTFMCRISSARRGGCLAVLALLLAPRSGQDRLPSC